MMRQIRNLLGKRAMKLRLEGPLSLKRYLYLQIAR